MANPTCMNDQYTTSKPSLPLPLFLSLSSNHSECEQGKSTLELSFFLFSLFPENTKKSHDTAIVPPFSFSLPNFSSISHHLTPKLQTFFNFFIQIKKFRLNLVLGRIRRLSLRFCFPFLLRICCSRPCLVTRNVVFPFCFLFVQLLLLKYFKIV